jgi:COP9 signalosome complex subunit 1
MQAIENVSQSYGDSAKLIRFQFIADVCCCLNKEEKEEEELGVILDAKSRYEIAREALRRAEEICKRGGTRNAEIFKTVREKKKNLNELFSSGGNGGEEDVNMENDDDDDEEKEFVENWSSQMHLENQNEKKRLDEGLTSSKASSLKESIRLAHNDLGDYYYNIGNLKEAFTCYQKSREYGTSVKHTLALCMNSIRVALELNNMSQVLLYANKGLAILKNVDQMNASENEKKMTQKPSIIQQAGSGIEGLGVGGESKEEQNLTCAKFTCAAALAHLHFDKYTEAAKHFTSLKTEIGNSYTEVVSQQDVAVYGGLCALATFDREQLKKHIVHENVTFRDMLSTVPEMRDIIEDFWNSRYPQCLSKLNLIKKELLLDIHIGKHVHKLFSLIRQKALIQYTKPFSALSLTTMASAFNCDSVETLEKEIADLITRDKIRARIDSRGEKILRAKEFDKRTETFERVQKTAEKFVENARDALLRSSLNRLDLAL